MTEQVKLSKVEDIKNASCGLRGGIAEAIATNAPKVTDDDGQLLKFHGSYGQYNRDTATERKKKGLEKEHMFMIRARIPGGRLTRDQYLAFDAISGKYADGTLRITTRQTVQLHGVVGAKALKNTIQNLNDEVVTTLATLINVEDVKPFCDFYSPSRIQRDDLLVTVPTNGKSPRLAGWIRRAIESWLVPEWAERLEELAAQRGICRMERAGMQKLKELTDKYIDDRKWLP